MSPTDGVLCQSVILPSLMKTGRGGVEFNTPGLYLTIVKKFIHSDKKKKNVAKWTLTFINKGYHESSKSWLQF